MPNFNLLRRLEVAFFGRFLLRFCGLHYWPLFRKLACKWAEVTSEAHVTSNLVPSHGHLPLEIKLSSRKDFLPSVCCTTLKSSLLQQLWQVLLVLYNATTIYPTTELSLHRSPASGPAMEKRTMFVLTHSANFNPRGILITSRTSFSRRLFMSQEPRGRSFHCPFQLYGKKNRKKRYLHLTRRKVPNLVTQLK